MSSSSQQAKDLIRLPRFLLSLAMTNISRVDFAFFPAERDLAPPRRVPAIRRLAEAD